MHIQEYRAPADVLKRTSRAPAAESEIARVAGEVLGVPRERIALKIARARQRRLQHTVSLDQRNEFIEVQEGGLDFQVNLTDYLDTGLFLDHRLVRAKVRELAGRKVLPREPVRLYRAIRN